MGKIRPTGAIDFEFKTTEKEPSEKRINKTSKLSENTKQLYPGDGVVDLVEEPAKKTNPAKVKR